MSDKPVEYIEPQFTPDTPVRLWPWMTLAAFVVALLFLIPSSNVTDTNAPVNDPIARSKADSGTSAFSPG